MAFGFTPKFKQTIELNGFGHKQYLAIALAAVKQLNWEPAYTSKSGFVAIIGGGLFSSTEEFTLALANDSVEIVSKLVSNGIYDMGKNKKHVNDFLDAFEQILALTTETELEEMTAALEPVFSSEDEDLLTKPPLTVQEKFKSFFGLFVPSGNYFVTPIIMDINILIFIIMAISGVGVFLPDGQDLIKWGANFGPLTVRNEWWRLFTNTFLHFGILHLLLNMYALLYIGVLLEPHLGKLRFFTAYVVTGIIASLTSVYWHSFTISAGASGAIFGMYGIFLAMLTTNFIERSLRKPLLMSIGIFVLMNLANGMKAGIDNAAHIGGLLSGLVIGYIYYPGLANPSKIALRYATIAVVIIGLTVSSFVIYGKIPRDSMKYDSKMEEFTNNENDALAIFKIDNKQSKAVLLLAVDQGLSDWKKNLKLVQEMNKLDIPVQLLVRNQQLQKYCELRLKSYNFIRKSIDENTAIYADSVKAYNEKIADIIDQIKGKQ